MGRRLARNSGQEVNAAAWYSKGGRKHRNTRLGSSSTRGPPGTDPSAIPHRTNSTGNGNGTRRATTARAVTAIKSPMMSSRAGYMGGGPGPTLS